MIIIVIVIVTICIKQTVQCSVGTHEGKRTLGISTSIWGIILKQMFNKWDGTAWTGLIWLRIRTNSGHL